MADLTLSVDRDLRFLRATREPEGAAWFGPLKAAVLKRDRSTCQACGFESKVGMEVAPADPDRAGTTAADHITLCPLCHAAVNLGVAPSGQAYVIHAPELTQAQISQLCHSFWRAQDSGDALASVAGQVMSELASRRRLTEMCFGLTKDASDRVVSAAYVRTFAGMLMGLSDKEYLDRRKTIGAFRLLPARESFASQIDAWKKEAYRDPLVSAWPDIAAQYLAASPTPEKEARHA